MPIKQALGHVIYDRNSECYMHFLLYADNREKVTVENFSWASYYFLT